VRLGIFGGTFDPPHKGHAALARAAVRELKLDKLTIMPAGDPPLKAARPQASARDRLQMARLAFRSLPRTVVSPAETRRAGPSYTYQTLRDFRRRRPSAEWFLVVGGDSWRNFHKWRRWREILAGARLAVGLRAGTRPGAAPAVRAASTVLKARLPDVSSTAIRAGRAAGTAPAVRRYIRAKSLYS
jgi:nicotinate-nucleotide adenylyltransferase